MYMARSLRPSENLQPPLKTVDFGGPFWTPRFSGRSGRISPFSISVPLENWRFCCKFCRDSLVLFQINSTAVAALTLANAPIPIFPTCSISISDLILCRYHFLFFLSLFISSLSLFHFFLSLIFLLFYVGYSSESL